MFDFTINEKGLAHAVERAREKGIVIPTFAQMRNPETAPESIKKKLKNVGLWDLDPANLFRLTWKNEPVAKGGGFGEVNHLILPPTLTGIKATVVVLCGKWFPTGAHKVGAAFGCLAPRLVTGQFDPVTQKAAWPSTGNYCRGGAYDSALLGCASIAILPEGMSKERFEWLEQVAGQVIKTPGCESNVKEIFDKCWELRKSGDDIVIFNQFDEFGNYLWHYNVTGPALEEVLLKLAAKGTRGTKHIRGVVMSTGSGGTLASGDYIKNKYPWAKIAAAEALQCPTLLANGFGDHRIEGIGDKHVPWIHNVKNTDMIIAVDDEAPCNCIRMANEPAGKAFLKSKGFDDAYIESLNQLGISGWANALAAVKFAKHYELGEGDLVITMATDSMEMYQSRLDEMNTERGAFTSDNALITHERYVLGQNTADMEELTYPARKRVHNLKYYTWVEQQGKTYKEIVQQWESDSYWEDIPKAMEKFDQLIIEFNKKVGLN